MSLLNELYNDVRTSFDWDIDNGTHTSYFGSSSIEFNGSDDCTIVNPVVNESDFNKIATITDIIKSFISAHNPRELILESSNLQIQQLFHTAFERVAGMYGYGCMVEDSSLIMCKNLEFLSEEPNSSLMYHRMFPNKRLNAELESYGYKFRDGGGMKLMRKHMGTTNRNSGPHERRTMQSIVIFKDGRIFRKIAKQKWNQLVDPSDKDSETWGVKFQRKMVATERKRRREQGIEIHFK